MVVSGINYEGIMLLAGRKLGVVEGRRFNWEFWGI